MGLDTKTYWLTERRSQCDFDFDNKLVEKLSQLFVVTICKCSINPIANPRPVYTRTQTRDSMYNIVTGSR
jgi:hypothetical protein